MTMHLPIHFSLVLLAIWLPVSFTITYIMAVSYHHIYPIWPTISNTGALAPESCVFSLLVNGAAVIFTFILYIRHCQLLEYTRCRPTTGPRYLFIHIAAIIGYIGGFGLYIDANFQETTILSVHKLGAQTCIYGSTLYFITQTVFSFWMAPDMNSKKMIYVRAIINIFNVGFIVASYILHFVGAQYFKGKTISEYLNWSPDVPGWPFKVATSVLEWITVLCFILYALTYYPEFKRIELEVPSVQPLPEFDAPFLISFAVVRQSFKYPEHRKRQDQSIKREEPFTESFRENQDVLLEELFLPPGV